MRHSGRTTREIDKAVQMLFEKGTVIVPTIEQLEKFENGLEKKDENTYYSIDPSLIETHKNIVQRDLFKRIVRRLDVEHRDHFNFSKTKMKITLID